MTVALRTAYGVAVAGLGVLILRAHDVGAIFEPVPPWMPGRHAVGLASGSVLLGGGLALLAERTTRVGAAAIAANFVFVWLLLLNLPSTLAQPKQVGNWEGCGLVMAVAAGGWILFASRSTLTGPAARIVGDSGVKLAQRLFALGVPLVGFAHFADLAGSTVFVPSWLPWPVGWVALTGFGHVAAGLGILSGVLPRLAARLEAAQISAFVLLSHIPAVHAAPTDRVQWAMLVYAAAIAASAWLVAGSLGPASDRPSRLVDE